MVEHVWYGSSFPHLRKLETKVLSQVVSSSSTERCWSTYSFIHSVKRNRLNENQVESLVYVHYNLRLLTHYCERAKTDRSYVTWDNNLEEHNLEDGALTYRALGGRAFGQWGWPCSSNNATTSFAPGSTSQPPPASMRGDHAGPSLGRGSSRSTLVATGDDNPIPFVHKPRENKLEISRGKRKHP